MYEDLKNGTFFRHDDSTVFAALDRAFFQELHYLRASYATTYPDSATTTTSSPSEVLYDDKLFAEINRTLNGIQALRWLHNDDYEAFTHNQIQSVKLSRTSFQQLRQFFATGLRNFEDTDALFTLIVMQMTNDLGKSTRLQDAVAAQLPPTEPLSGNHDMVMLQVLRHAESLVPSFQNIPRRWRNSMERLVVLSANFNPAQLIQGECPPAAMDTLIEFTLTPDEIDMKFMELFLDMSGAAGHKNHEGALVMTEPTFQGMMKARNLSMEVTQRHMTSLEAYYEMLQFRIDIIGDARGRLSEFERWTSKDFALARLLCMGRVVDAETADTYMHAFENLDEEIQKKLQIGLGASGTYTEGSPSGIRGRSSASRLWGIQPTYMPSVLALVKSPNMEAKLAALFTYLADVLHISLGDLADDAGLRLEELPDQIEIVERDVRFLDETVKSKAFDIRPSAALLFEAGMPKAQIAKLWSD